MAKTFAPRISKRERKTIDLAGKLGRDVFKISDDRLLAGAKLVEIFLDEIVVKEQVRTKFVDSSIRELSKNIQTNGLIQPLVLHKQNGKYTLICGERRYRAMSLIQMKKSPCFVLSEKSKEELLAIQFSENSSREALHYVDKADGILNYQIATKASERKIQEALGISKSEVHRSLLVAKMSDGIKEAAKKYDIEKYVLLEFDFLDDSMKKEKILKRILAGEITKRAKLARIVKTMGLVKAGRRIVSKSKPKKLVENMDLNSIIMAMKSKNRELDADTIAALKEMVSS